MSGQPDVFFLPIEPLEERYTAQMLRWVELALRELGVMWMSLLPVSAYTTIQHGQWLDTYGAARYRSEQIALVAEQFSRGNVKPGALFLIGDVWYPGIEAIRLMAELSGVKIHLAGWHYAGMADPSDLLTRSLGEWARAWEHWLVRYVDHICVGSVFHRRQVVKAFGHEVHDRIHPLGLPWRPDEVCEAGHGIQREKIVVFPHRLAPEKNPDAFFALAREYRGSGWRFVVSTSNPHGAANVPDDMEVVTHADKRAYYRFLSSCSIYYSGATQETFGYALHEAIALGLCVVAPRRCSYPEMLQGDPRFLYDPISDPVGRRCLEAAMSAPVSVPYEYTSRFDANEKTFIERVLSDTRTR